MMNTNVKIIVSSIPNTASCATAGMDPIIFVVEGVKKLLQNLDCKKANGPANIPTRLIKDTASEIADVVCFLFNQSYSLSQLPADWCKANVVPTFKALNKTLIVTDQYL